MWFPTWQNHIRNASSNSVHKTIRAPPLNHWFWSTTMHENDTFSYANLEQVCNLSSGSKTDKASVCQARQASNFYWWEPVALYILTWEHSRFMRQAQKIRLQPQLNAWNTWAFISLGWIWTMLQKQPLLPRWFGRNSEFPPWFSRTTFSTPGMQTCRNAPRRAHFWQKKLYKLESIWYKA